MTQQEKTRHYNDNVYPFQSALDRAKALGTFGGNPILEYASFLVSPVNPENGRIVYPELLSANIFLTREEHEQFINIINRAIASREPLQQNEEWENLLRILRNTIKTNNINDIFENHRLYVVVKMQYRGGGNQSLYRSHLIIRSLEALASLINLINSNENIEAMEVEYVILTTKENLQKLGHIPKELL